MKFAPTYSPGMIQWILVTNPLFLLGGFPGLCWYYCFPVSVPSNFQSPGLSSSPPSPASKPTIPFSLALLTVLQGPVQSHLPHRERSSDRLTAISLLWMVMGLVTCNQFAFAFALIYVIIHVHMSNVLSGPKWYSRKSMNFGVGKRPGLEPQFCHSFLNYIVKSPQVLFLHLREKKGKLTPS